MNELITASDGFRQYTAKLGNEAGAKTSFYRWLGNGKLPIESRVGQIILIRVTVLEAFTDQELRRAEVRKGRLPAMVAHRIVCAKLGFRIPKTTFYRWLSTGKLKADRLPWRAGRVHWRYYIQRETVEKMVEACKQGDIFWEEASG
jgi:hypothetical protein